MSVRVLEKRSDEKSKGENHLGKKYSQRVIEATRGGVWGYAEYLRSVQENI